MKVGDLVSLKMLPTKPPQSPQLALVLDVHYADDGNINGVTVQYFNGDISPKARPGLFEVISESR